MSKDQSTISHRDIAHRWFKRDDVHWMLWCLVDKMREAHEIIERPLPGTAEALANGWATVSRQYADKRYNYRVIRITDAGRRELAAALGQVKDALNV